MKIKAISLHQPYGSYIVSEAKRYETRSWQVSYRGLVAIHAAKKWDDEAIEMMDAIHRMFPAIPRYNNPPLGAMLGICRMLDCVRTESFKPSEHERAVGDWRPKRFAWEMEVLEVFEQPIPTRGEQGLFDWEFPAEMLAKRVAIVGSRDYEDLEAVRRYVSTLPKDVTIITGGARGVDKAAEEAARAYGLNVVVINVNTRGLSEDDSIRWSQFAQRAMIRNGEIVQMAGSLVAFWDERSPGTKAGIEKAQKAGIPVIINPNTEVKEAAPKQLMFEGFRSTYDEGAYITALERAKHFSSSGESVKRLDFEWHWPWQASKKEVWVKADGGAYRLVPIESDEARKWANILRGWMYPSETMVLREWLKARPTEKENFISLPCEHFDLNRYAVDDALHSVKESDIEYTVIPVEKLTFTQSSYHPGICLKYLEAGRVREFDSNLLPMVYQFKDDERYFLTNGTHRGIGWLMGLDHKRRAAMPVRLARIPYSLEALYEQAIEVDESEDDELNFYAEVLLEALKILEQAKEKELASA